MPHTKPNRPFSSIVLLAISLMWFTGCDFSGSDDVAKLSGSQENNTASDPQTDSSSSLESKPSPSADPPEQVEDGESQKQDEPSESAEAQPAPATTKPQLSADAFRMAAYEGDIAKVQSGVESGIDVNGFDPTQKLTALHMAAYNGHTKTVEYLISKGAEVDCRDGEKKTPLIHACTGPFSETVKLLIESGADVNAVDGTEGFTPLMMAAGLGQPEIVEILLANQAVVSQKDEDQETAIDHARNAGHEAIVKRLEQISQKKEAPQE